MRALVNGNTDYQVVTIMKVDWDTYKKTDLVSDLGVRRRSTLVMFNKGVEVDRVIAQTATSVIEPLFIKALAG